MSWFPGPHVLHTVGVNHCDRYSQADRAVDTALTAIVMLLVGVEGVDFIAQEVGAFIAGVRNERLLFIEL